MGEIERNVVIVKALMNIPGKPGGSALCLINSENLCTFKGKSARHNKADIARA